MVNKSQLKRGIILVPNTLTRARGKGMNLEIINLSDSEITLTQGTRIATGTNMESGPSVNKIITTKEDSEKKPGGKMMKEVLTPLTEEGIECDDEEMKTTILTLLKFLQVGLLEGW